MFRMFQGWLSMSKTGPGEGTLMVNPLLQLSTAYFLLRPFFVPVNQPKSLISGDYSAEFLDADNWRLEPRGEVTSDLQGASPGHAQELNQVLHPHLDLRRSMVHVPKISPGDYVAWHCDSKFWPAFVSPKLTAVFAFPILCWTLAKPTWLSSMFLRFQPYSIADIRHFQQSMQ
jgi:hypothetical protein